SVHLLRALMYKEDFRSNTLFNLREHFPLHCGCPSKFGASEEVPEIKPVLTNDVKRILYRTTEEAVLLRDYWIDTEHLVLGILAEEGCPAQRYLAMTGLTLTKARRVVAENKGSRPSYGPPLPERPAPSLWDWLVAKWKMRTHSRSHPTKL